MLDQAVDKAFEVLKTYDWGTDRNQLNAIDHALVSTENTADAKVLEEKLIEAMKSDISHSAKDFVARKLRSIGTAASVPALAPLLTNDEYSNLACFALESIPCKEAATALADAIGKTKGTVQAGIIGSAVKRDVDVVGKLAQLVKSNDAITARCAALGLGTVGTAAAAKALAQGKQTESAIDGQFQCAEALLAGGKKNDAKAIYVGLMKSSDKNVKLAAMKGMLSCK